jgi:hypothetical protein
MLAGNRVDTERARLDSPSSLVNQSLAGDDACQAGRLVAGCAHTAAGLPHRAPANLLLLYEGVKRAVPSA